MDMYDCILTNHSDELDEDIIKILQIFKKENKSLDEWGSTEDEIIKELREFLDQCYAEKLEEEFLIETKFGNKETKDFYEECLDKLENDIDSFCYGNTNKKDDQLNETDLQYIVNHRFKLTKDEINDINNGFIYRTMMKYLFNVDLDKVIKYVIEEYKTNKNEYITINDDNLYLN